MAIVRSLGVGEGKKSAGMLTYRSVRGRTIASRRIISNQSKSPAQVVQRNLFGDASKFMMFILNYIETAFEKSKYGSARNNYLKSNPDLNDWGGISLLGEVKENVVSIGDALLTSNAFGMEVFGIKMMSVGSAGGVQVSGTERATEVDTWGGEELGHNHIFTGLKYTFANPVIPSDVTLDLFIYYQAPEVKDEHHQHNLKTLVAPGHHMDDMYGLDFAMTSDDKFLQEISFDASRIGKLGPEVPHVSSDALIIPVIKVKGKVVSNPFMTAYLNHTYTPEESGGEEVLP